MNSAEKVQSHPFKDTASLRSDHVSASHDGAVHTEERFELSSLIVPERSQAKDLIVFESQKRTWFGALNDGVTTALNYISSSIAIGYATRIGCSHEKKFKILDQLLNSKDASTFEVVLDKMKITQASVLSFFSTRDPVKAFERMSQFQIFSEGERFKLLSVAIENRDPQLQRIVTPIISETEKAYRQTIGFDRLVSRLPFEYETHLNELFVEQLQEHFPELVIQNRESFASLVMFDLDKTCNRLIAMNPRILITNRDLFDKMPPTCKEHACAQLREAARIDAQQDPIQVFKQADRYQLDASGYSELFVALLEKNEFKYVTDNINRFDVIPLNERSQLISRWERLSAAECYRNIEKIIAWSGSLELCHGTLESMRPFWKRLVVNRDIIGMSGSILIKSLILDKISTHPHLVRDSLVELNLNQMPWRKEVAVALAEKYPESIPLFLHECGIVGPIEQATLLKMYMRHDPKVAREWFSSNQIPITPELERSAISV